MRAVGAGAPPNISILHREILWEAVAVARSWQRRIWRRWTNAGSPRRPFGEMESRGEERAGGIYLPGFWWVPRRTAAGLAPAHHAAVFNFSMGGQGDNAARSHLTCW